MLDADIMKSLASRDEQLIIKGLQSAESRQWNIERVISELQDFFEVLMPNGHFEKWLDINFCNSANAQCIMVSGVRVPLSFIFSKIPSICPFLSWKESIKPVFTIYEYIFPTHDLLDSDLFEIPEAPDSVEEVFKELLYVLFPDTKWNAVEEVTTWKDLATAFNKRSTLRVDENDFLFENFFSGWRFVGEALLEQVAGESTFLFGHYSEFEGHHNDDEFLAIMASVK